MRRLRSFLARLRGGRRRRTPWHSDHPVREELFSVERLEDHARHLATTQVVPPKRHRGRSLAWRLEDNGAVLHDAYRGLVSAIDAGSAITPAAEWLVDNYHLVEKQVRALHTDLPADYYGQLPKLAAGPFAGYPRVFGLAWAYVAHTDSRFDPDTLRRYVHAYQEVQPLTIGELWAVSLTLRMVLLENLRRLSQQIMDSRAARLQADLLADRLLGVGVQSSEPVPAVLAGQASMRLSDAFAIQLVHRLRDQDPRITPALDWLHHCLAAHGMTADTVVTDVHRSQGAANVTVRNIITSLRLIADVDWSEIFEHISLVDDVLAAGSDFTEMDFASRTLYRSAIEDLARGSGRTELEIARAAIAAAPRRARSTPCRSPPTPAITCSPAGGRPSRKRSATVRSCCNCRPASAARSASAPMPRRSPA